MSICIEICSNYITNHNHHNHYFSTKDKIIITIKIKFNYYITIFFIKFFF